MVFRILLCTMLIFPIMGLVNGQKIDSIQNATKFSGTIAATNNGISLIPSFSLGKPATVIELAIKRSRFSFEPQLRFDLTNARPWSFIYWLRYKLIQNPKMKLQIGVHPSYVFSYNTIIENGISKEAALVKRYWAGELYPSIALSDKTTIGLYYLQAYGLGKNINKNTHFLSIMAHFSHISVYKDYYIKLNPQLFYLSIDGVDGYYATETLTLSKKGLPLSISSVVTKVIMSDIAGKDFVWNLSLNYSFN